MVRLGLLPRFHLPHTRTYIRCRPVFTSALKQQALNRHISRHFTSTPRIRQKQQPADQKAEAQTFSRTDPLENVKPETVQKPSNGRPHTEPMTDALLSEQTVSNKEQRKADWAIMKEMSRYLWPKVCQICSIEFTRVPDGTYRVIWVRRPGLGQL